MNLIDSSLTDEYGYVNFGDSEVKSNVRLSAYIRLALRSDTRKVVEFLRCGWSLSKPDLILSVTGGGQRCRMSAHLRKVFQRGLVAAAATTSNEFDRSRSFLETDSVLF